MARSFDLGKQNRWLRLLESWQRSTLSIREFCERRHLAESAFFFWRRTLRQRGLLPSTSTPSPPPTPTPAFVPLLLEPTPHAMPLELVLAKGRVLRIPPGFDPRRLAELLTLLEKSS